MPRPFSAQTRELLNLLPPARELRERAEKVSARAETFKDAEASEIMREVAAIYEKLADRLEIEFG